MSQDRDETGDGPSDHSLLARFRQGSQDAATELYVRYAARLRGLTQAQMSPALAVRVDVEDIVQSVFGSFFHRVERGYYDVPVGEELWRLLLVIALRKIRGQGAYHGAVKRDHRRTVTGDAIDAQPAADDGAVAFLRLVVDDALGKLPPAQRQMVELRIDGHDVAAIARQTGRSRRTVERLLQDARRRLGGLLDEDG